MDENLDLGELIDMFRNVKEEKANYEKAIKRLGEQYELLEQAIILKMRDQKIEKAAHGGMTVTPTQKTYPHLEDWEITSNWIIEERMIHLLERRIAVTSYRELLEMGRSVPGVVPLVRTRLATRTS